MPTDFGFRFSTYLALGLACATLGYAEFAYLPSVSAFTVIVLGMMVVAFRRDGRNELSLAMANRVGLMIGIAVIAYLAFQVFRQGESLLDRMPFPAGMLPYLGPVFMVLIPAKLFRPKHVGDWWAMHGVGLAVVCLACVMEDDSTLAVLVTAYLVVGVWSLMLFYFRRGGGAVPADSAGQWNPPGRTTETPTRVVSAADAPSRSRFGGIKARRPVSYLIAAAAAGFLFFILTPRTDTPHWSLSSYREVGYTSDEQAPDLNKTGDLKDNRDRAFEVVVKNLDGSPKLDIDLSQRWRGACYVTYQGGKWETQKGLRGSMIAIQALSRPVGISATTVFESSLQAAGSDAYILDFELNGKRKDPVLADPIWWAPAKFSPLMTKLGNEGITWSPLGDGSFSSAGRARSKHYRQAYRPPPEPDLGPAFQLLRNNAFANGAFGIPGRPRPEINPGDEDQLYLTTIDHLRYNPLPRVKAWTEKLIDRLVIEGHLPKEVAARYVPEDGSFPVSDFEVVARAINRHFTTSSEFSYGTENTRVDKSLDPVEDFLINTKSGSCEWYATALTLCLRSVGIPAQCVLGFKGCESEDDGRYTVRQDHAHAWVEVLIPRPIPEGFEQVLETDAFRNPLPPATRVWHWLSLDPTPGSDVQTGSSSGITGLWGSVRAWWLAFFNDFVIRYDPERRQRAAAAAEKWATAYWRVAVEVGMALVALVLVGLMYRQFRRKPSLPSTMIDPIPGWYRRLLSAAAGVGLVPAGGETPREFADRIAAAVPVAGEPTRALTDHLYRIRYAGEPSAPADDLSRIATAVESALSQLSIHQSAQGA